ncbi:MAG TPA: squalene synthase HpnC [Candidatus Acidoferrales bacterium]|nr:squalene synthase HpnC [Candidatus Acidoferrales bacterium]
MLGQQELEIARTLPPEGCSLAEAERYTRWLATHHYENFRVVSWLLPSRLHKHFYNIYSYCRWSDDLGDEVPDSKRALALLNSWDEEVQRAFRGSAGHPVLMALAGTARQFEIPVEPFRDLLVAFRQDQTVPRYKSWEDVIGYCRYSANPVGRLVLYLFGYRDAERQALSDATCTALQLANFWQDVGRDLEKGRIYIPLELAAQHGVTEKDIVSRTFDARYVELMKDLIARTRALFATGAPLAFRVAPEFRVDVELFSRGGCAVLDAIEAMGYDTLHKRPAITGGVQARLLGRALISRLLGVFRAPGDGDRKSEGASLAGRHA